MALTLAQATTISTRLAQQAAAQGLPVDKYIFSMSLIPLEKRQQLYSQYQEAMKMIQPVPGVTTSIDTSRASIVSELPPATGTERFTPVVPPTKTGTSTVPSGPSITPPETKLKIDIPITTAELKTIADAQAKGLCVGTMKSYYTIKTYKVGTADGKKIYVEAMNDTAAKQKAQAAGYRVSSIVRYFGFPTKATTAKTSTTTAKTDTVEIKDEMGGTVLIPKDQFDALPQEYKDIALAKGWRALDTAIYQGKKTFETSNTQLPDGNWMANSDIQNLREYDQANGTNYTQIATVKGWEALQGQIATDEADRDSAIGTMSKYKTDEGYDLLAAKIDGVTPRTMQLAGFDSKDVQWAEDTYKTSVKTGVALPGEVTWLDTATGKKYSDAEYKKLLADWDAKWKAAIGKPEFYELPPNPRNTVRLSDESVRRKLVEGVSMFVFQPARALLPEVGIKDIGKLEWAIGGAQIATFLMPFVPVKAMPVVSGVAAGVFGYATAKSWSALSPAEKALGVGGTVLVGLPALLALGSKFRPAISGVKVAKGEVLATSPQGRLQLLNRIVRWSGDIKVQRVEGPAATKINKAYLEMGHEFGQYTNTQLALKEVQNAISEMGLAKSKVELNYLNRLRAVESKLTGALSESGDSLVRKTQTFTDLYLDKAGGVGDLAPWELQEIVDRPKTILMDSDALTTQLFGTRNALEITSDIREVTKQIDVIEDATKRGMAPGQVREYGKLVDTLNTEIDNLNRELRARFVATGEEVSIKGETLRLKVITQQQRLVRAVEELERFKGTAQEYPTYRKGELATEAAVIRAERDIMEGIQKTTETMWGKESYSSVLQKLNNQLDDIISDMRKAGVKTDKATKASFDIYDAIKNQDPKALRAAVERLRLEAGKIPDKPLQLKAVDQVKQLEGLTAEKVMARFKAKGTTGGGKTEKWLGLTREDIERAMAETSEDRMVGIKRDAERLIQRRYEELTRNIPDNVKRYYGTDSEGIMEYLERTMDPDYFKNLGFEDIYDYLDPTREIERLYQKQLGREREWDSLTAQEAERDMAKKRLSETIDPARKEKLSDHVRELDRSIEKQKVALKEATKTEPTIQKTITEAEREKMKVEKSERSLITPEEAAKDKAARIKAEERAAQLIKAATKEKPVEQAPAKGEPYKGGFPGITRKTARERAAEYRTRVIADRALDGLIALGLSSKVVTQAAPAIRTAVRTGIQTATKTQTQTKTATKTQVKTAIQTAVQTALKTQLKTIPSTKLQTITKTVTDVVVDTMTTTSLLRFTPPPTRTLLRPPQVFTRQLPKREGPALAVWKQGRYWVSIFPPFRTTGKQEDVVYSLKRPPWGSVIAKGRHAPKRTLRSMGKVPELIVVPMGVVTARIRGGRHLTFSRSNGRKRGRVIE